MKSTYLVVAAAAMLGASAAWAADTFTIDVTTDPFASVNLRVRVSAPNRAGYLQEGSPYKVDPNWQFVDSVLCGQTTREIQVWVNPSARGAAPAKLTAEFALTTGDQTIGQSKVEREIPGGTAKGFVRAPAQDFVLLINRTCR